MYCDFRICLDLRIPTRCRTVFFFYPGNNSEPQLRTVFRIKDIGRSFELIDLRRSASFFMNGNCL